MRFFLAQVYTILQSEHMAALIAIVALTVILSMVK